MGWEAALELRFAAEGGATRLVHRAHRGPFFVQRPFLPEGPDVCHIYLLHPPGGLVGGDDLRLDLVVGEGARALVTTPAAGKAYRTSGAPVRQAHALRVGAFGALEWLPQETIIYDGASATLETRVDLAPGALFIGAETICLGLPARSAPFAQGSCRQRFEIWRADRPLFVERARFDGGGDLHRARWGTGGATVLAVLAAAPAPAPSVVEALRARAALLFAGDLAAVTVLGDGDVLVCRYAGGSASRARELLHDGWRILRPAVMGRAAVAPRIWAT